MAQHPLAVPLTCSSLVNIAVDSVATGRLDAAERILLEAIPRCADEPRLVRELAGIRFRQARYADAGALATAYVARVPRDTLGWQLLATSRFLDDDPHGALDAWNRIGRPHVQELTLVGTAVGRRADYQQVIGIREHTVLRANQLRIARRRMNDLPGVSRASIHYQPLPSGAVQVGAAVVERPVLGRWWWVAARTAARALGSQTVGLELASPAGWGERWQAEWRWEEARPRLGLRLDLPVTPGVITVEASWERLRVSVDTAVGGVSASTWHMAAARYGWWASPAIRPEFAVGLESWNDGRRFLTISTRSEARLLDDRLRFQLTASEAVTPADGPSYRSAGVRTMVASSLGLRRASWSLRVGADWVSADAPLGAWPLVNQGMDRAVTLRAEPPIEGSAMQARAMGRAIVHAGIGADHPIGAVGPLTIAVGAFVDGAEVMLPAQPSIGNRSYLDGGGGIRVGLAGGAWGTVRLDLAWGLLADRGAAVSLGYHEEWPPWSRTAR